METNERKISWLLNDMNKKVGFFMEQFGLGGTDVQLVNLVNNWPDDSDEIYYITNRLNKGITLFNSLLKRKCKVIVIDLKSYGYLRQKIIESKLPKNIQKLINCFVFLFKYLLLLTDIFRISRILKQYSFDIFVSDNGAYPASDSCRAAVFAGLLAGIKKRYFLIHHASAAPNKLFIPIEFLIDKLIQKIVNGIITVSEATKNSLLSNRFFTGKITAIHNGIEDCIPSQNCLNLKEKYGIDKDKKVIGMMGNIEFHKGHHILIEAASKIIQKYPRTHFLFIGSLYDENWQRTNADKVIELINSKNLQSYITLTGYLEGHPLDFINQFDVLVMPTLDFEGFGLVLAEAMILKKPVVATSVGAIPEVIINGESGILVSPGKPDELANGIIELLANENKTKQMSDNARVRYEKYFTAKIMAKNYYNLMNK